MKVLKRARLGNLEGIGSTKAEAAANLDKQIQWLAQHGGTMQVESNFGLVGILVALPEGWCYQIVAPEDIGQTHKTHFGTCSFGSPSYSDALSTMRNAMCQRAWSPDVDDAAHIAGARCLPHDARDLASLFTAYRQTAKAA